jgi:uncharacterized protein
MGKAKTFQERYGPWVVVAGASVGLGAEYATQLAAHGLHLVLIARRQEQLKALAKQLISDYHIEVRTIPLDLSRDDIGTVVTDGIKDIEIGLLVYNAATSKIGPFIETTLHDHLEEVAVNCRAPLTLAYLLGQGMLTRGRGGIILMSSLSSSQGTALIANYAATKSYNRILAEGLWDEFRPHGVDVLACCASSVSTPNYLASNPGRESISAMSPRAVVTETLAALGKRPFVIPGSSNRVANFLMQRILPHQMSIKIIGRVMRNMYSHA